MGYYYDIIRETQRSARKVERERKAAVKNRAKNPAGKMRTKDNPYVSWTDPRSGWKYHLLKSWQADNSKEYGRWLMRVEGWSDDIGDEYTENMRFSLALAWRSNRKSVQWDTSVWPDWDSLKSWAWGER